VVTAYHNTISKEHTRALINVAHAPTDAGVALAPGDINRGILCILGTIGKGTPILNDASNVKAVNSMLDMWRRCQKRPSEIFYTIGFTPQMSLTTNVSIIRIHYIVYILYTLVIIDNITSHDCNAAQPYLLFIEVSQTQFFRI